MVPNTGPLPVFNTTEKQKKKKIPTINKFGTIILRDVIFLAFFLNYLLILFINIRRIIRNLIIFIYNIF